MSARTLRPVDHIRRLRRWERFWFALLTAAAGITVAPVVVIVAFLLYKGASAISWQFLTQPPTGDMTSGGILTPLVGTIYLSTGTLIVAVPLGVLAAVYLSEYARPGPVLRLIRLAITNLAGVPSVVYGLFGLALFVVALRLNTSIIAGACTLGLLVLPIVITAAEEALRQVPQSWRLASLALGATKWQTIRWVVLPNALPGILTAVILSLSRAAGETAPILFTAAAYYLPRLPRSIFEPCMALPYHLYVLSTQVPNAPDRVKWGTALVLLAVVMLLNLGAIVIRQRLLSRRQWQADELSGSR